MPAERYYLPTSLQTGDDILVTETEFHHLIHVMRTKEGDPIEVVNGKGVLASGYVKKIEKKHAIIHLENTQKAISEKQIILAQGIPRPNRLDFIIEKGTELGMTELWLFPGDRGERKDFNEHQLDRALAVAAAAMKQCGRLFLPKIVVRPRLNKWEKPEEALFFGDVKKTAPLFPSYWNKKRPEKLAFFIGSESGLSQEEESILAGWNAQGIHLHENILRTDTAALVALALAAQWDS